MRLLTEKQYSQPIARKVSMCYGFLCVVILLAFAVTAGAQNVTQLNTPVTTTLWAGTADWQQFGLSSLTAPSSGVILSGTAISAFTGQPVRHIWYGDQSNGMCRIDPEVDDPDTTQPAPGIGRFNNIERTCIGFIQAGGFAPQQITYDATTQTLYAADIPRTANGVIRMHYDPAGDNGQGSIDPIHVESLMGAQATRNAAGGCPVVVDPRTGAVPETMSAAALGPDGNLYIGWMRDGEIARIPHPATFNPALDSECAQIDVPMFAADARLGNGGAAGHTFGLAWIGHTLFGADNISPWILENADQCNTAANGFVRCGPVQGVGTEILGTFAPGPQAGLISDFTYDGPNTPYIGNSLVAMTLSGAVRVLNATDVQNISVQPQFGGSFCFITGGIIDPADLANETVYLGVDCTQGAINGAGSVYQLVPQVPAGAPPGVPTNVTASNATPPGATTGAANVSWLPKANGQQLSSYVVRTVLASDGTTQVVPDVNVTAGSNGIVPTSVQVTGLPLGTAVQFLVAASNTFGTSQFSIASAAFTPFVPTAPDAPTGVVATAGNKSAQVAWSAPANNGGLPITGYTVIAQLNGTTAVANMSASAGTTGVNFTGLTNGSTYNFVVIATNAAGNSANSLPSNAVTPAAPNIQDIAVTMNGPSSVNAGSFVTFAITVSNLGPGDAPNVTLADSLPGNFVSATTTQGACGVSGAQFNCTFGGMLAGGSLTVNLTIAIGTSAMTNSATATLRDLSGNVLNQDPSLTNNTASKTVNINSGTNNVSADIQITGSAQNGGPSVGASDLFTWQIKNSTGNATAPNVSFEAILPISFTLVPGSLSANQGGGCSVSPATPTQGQTLDCITSSLPGGQTMIVTYNVTTSVAGTFGTTGKTTSGANDPQPSNNSFSVNIQPK
jgi:uncharacterized repeat protein (TIGR01451 family)